MNYALNKLLRTKTRSRFLSHLCWVGKIYFLVVMECSDYRKWKGTFSCQRKNIVFVLPSVQWGRRVWVKCCPGSQSIFSLSVVFLKQIFKNGNVILYQLQNSDKLTASKQEMWYKINKLLRWMTEVLGLFFLISDYILALCYVDRKKKQQQQPRNTLLPVKEKTMIASPNFCDKMYGTQRENSSNRTARIEQNTEVDKLCSFSGHEENKKRAQDWRGFRESLITLYKGKGGNAVHRHAYTIHRCRHTICIHAGTCTLAPADTHTHTLFIKW